MKKFASIIMVTCILAFVSFTTFAAEAADTENPSDVENLKAEALNASVKLTWNEATDDVAVSGYKVHYGLKSVTKQGEKYEHVVDAKNVLTYTVSGLKNSSTYYFSVVAYDAAGNESISWAKEVSATPSGNGVVLATNTNDKVAPQVAEAEALNKEEVKVVFSEEIVLPAEDPQDEFSIENDDTFEPLAVLDAKMDEDDKDNKTVILTTEAQKENASYKITVGIDIKDKASNPIISGTSDTAIFKGSAKDKPLADAEGPKISTVESVDNEHILVNFNEAVVLSIDPADNFEITDEKNAKLTVLGVELSRNKEGVADAAAIIKTSAQEVKNYTLTVKGLKDEAGNEISTTSNSAVFKGIGTSEIPVDTVPPADVAKFVAKSLFQTEKFVVTLSWQLPKDTDVDKQIVYISKDKGTSYEQEATLPADAVSHEVDGLEAGEYFFKLTEVDKAGNESKGVITKVVLAETGPEIFGLIAVSLGLGRYFGRRKKQNLE